MKVLLLLSLFVVYVSALDGKAHWLIELAPKTDPLEFALEHGLKHLTHVVDNYHAFESSEAKTNANFQSSPQILSIHKQSLRKQYKRASVKINDPLYPSQWHLRRLHIEKVWEQGYTGRGVSIGIVDDGLQFTHPDLAANFDAADSWSFNANRASPMPSSDDGHGTSAAGVAAAAMNNHCGVGAAPNARLAGIQLIAQPVYDYVEGLALSYHKDKIKIYSCSWGPYDSGADLIGPGPATLAVLKNGFNSGSIFVWAGGNGRQNRDNVNYDGYANSIYTIAIGAVNTEDRQSYYSESGACLFAVTPSSGKGRGVVTTDLSGPNGYSEGECTMRFGGTSSATPLAAGIMALILEKHPGLNARQIQHIIAEGASKIDISGGEWSKPNARGYSHSHKYGFGLLEPPKLLAIQPRKLKPLVVAQSPYHPLRTIVPTAQIIRLNKPLDFIEQVEVTVSFYANKRGDVEIQLEKGGIVSILAEKRNDHHGGLTTWTYTTVRYWGQRSTAGEIWKVSLSAPRGRGVQLRGIQIKAYGT